MRRERQTREKSAPHMCVNICSGPMISNKHARCSFCLLGLRFNQKAQFSVSPIQEDAKSTVKRPDAITKMHIETTPPCRASACTQPTSQRAAWLMRQSVHAFMIIKTWPDLIQSDRILADRGCTTKRRSPLCMEQDSVTFLITPQAIPWASFNGGLPVR